MIQLIYYIVIRNKLLKKYSDSSFWEAGDEEEAEL